MPLHNAFDQVATETTLGEVADAATGRTVLAATKVVTVPASPLTVSPPAGQALAVVWVSATPEPDADAFPQVAVVLGADELYRCYAVQHRQRFVGAVDEDLVVSVSGTGGSVAVTVHYEVV